MPSETVREYEIAYSSVKLPDSEHWGAMVTIYGPSSSPMHRNCVFPEQRVSIDMVFDDAAAAETEARKAALRMIGQGERDA
ncbi:hypothetical protein [Herminiimonas sp. CN]|uniref:hypothetical protein n=1 Tax=Herminiimonas sp. CN TaxID=1349818 RepID=UPI0004744262|nr:hypothetical protein [Herminiimonas sp. CN]